MKNIWKWVLGIVIFLVVAAGLFGLGFVWRTHMMAAPVAIQRSAPNPPQWRGPMMGGVPPGGRMMAPRMGSMRGFSRGPFMPGMMLFGFLGRLIPLGLLLLLLLYVVYQLGKGRSIPAPVAPMPVTPVTVVPAPVTPTHLCPACNATVQDDWKHCPNCGEKQP